MKWIRKHPKAFGIFLMIVCGLGVFFSYARQQTLANTTQMKLADVPRTGGKQEDSFYYDQLTKKEKLAYDRMKQRLEKLEGGVLEFEEALSGREYLRVTSALENQGSGYFYGFYDIPMTKEDIYVKYENQDLTAVGKNTIEKCILFLACAEGLNEAGKYESDGRVSNLAEVDKGLKENREEGVEQIRATKAETEKILSEILSELPEEYGEKSTVDFFLKWMSEHMTTADDIGENALSFTGMDEVFEGAYGYNHVSAVTKGRATALGYAKILSELCKRAGMESHVVFGTWGKYQAYAKGYVLCEVEMDGQSIYIDAGGLKASELAGEVYMTELEAKNHMEFVNYFSYE